MENIEKDYDGALFHTRTKGVKYKGILWEESDEIHQWFTRKSPEQCGLIDRKNGIVRQGEKKMVKTL